MVRKGTRGTLVSSVKGLAPQVQPGPRDLQDNKASPAQRAVKETRVSLDLLVSLEEMADRAPQGCEERPVPLENQGTCLLLRASRETKVSQVRLAPRGCQG